MKMLNKDSITLVVPLFNEEENAKELLHKIYGEFDAQFKYELIVIDDGSTDKTRDIILANRNSQTKLIVFDSNQGQSAAIRSGIENASYNIIAIMDGDLQNDPKDFKDLIEELKLKDVDFIQGYRMKRNDSILKTIPSKVANRLISILFKFRVKDIGCAIKVFDRKTVENIVFFKDFHRYLPLLVFLEGYQVGQMGVAHFRRRYGKSKYGLSRISKVMRQLIAIKKKQLIEQEKTLYSIL